MNTDYQAQWTAPKAIQAWWATPDQQIFDRGWSPEFIAALRDPFPNPSCPASVQAQKFRQILRKHQQAGTTSLCLGAHDVITMYTIAELGFESIYVSGAMCSVTDTTTNEFGADMADYPYTTVPKKIEQLLKSQLLHTRLNNIHAITPHLSHKHRPIDFLVPLLADGDTGFGGPTATMKLAKLFVESGCAGFHVDDQVGGTKKWGVKTAPRVLVPVSEHIQRLSAVKLQFDIMAADCLIIHRTDAETAGYITSTIDPRDRPYILGSTNATIGSLSTTKLGEHEWTAAANLLTLDEAVERYSPTSHAQFLTESQGLNASDALQVAHNLLGNDFYWNPETPRSKEGWYRYRGGIDGAITRAIACAPYADILWSRTPSTSMEKLEKFAQEVLEAVPGRWLAYNLYCDVPGSAEELRSFTSKLGKLGYVWQFLSLAGPYASATGIHPILKEIRDNGLAGYRSHLEIPSREADISITKFEWITGDLTDALVAGLR